MTGKRCILGPGRNLRQWKVPGSKRKSPTKILNNSRLVVRTGHLCDQTDAYPSSSKEREWEEGREGKLWSRCRLNK